MKTRNFILLIVFLVLLDQIIKIVIDSYYLDSRFEIMPSLLYFSPILNEKYSYINGLFSLNMSVYLHLSIVGFSLLFLVLFYDYIHQKLRNDKALHISLTLCISAGLCNLIGIFFFGGILDYIYLQGYFTFDLKDIYVNLFLIIFLYSMHREKKRDPSFFSNKSIAEHFRKRFNQLKS